MKANIAGRIEQAFAQGATILAMKVNTAGLIAPNSQAAEQGDDHRPANFSTHRPHVDATLRDMELFMRSIFMFAALALLGSIIAASLGQAYAAIPDTTRVEGKTTKDYIQFTKKSKKAKKANLETQRTPT